jgi:hypothetical protein
MPRLAKVSVTRQKDGKYQAVYSDRPEVGGTHCQSGASFELSRKQFLSLMPYKEGKIFQKPNDCSEMPEEKGFILTPSATEVLSVKSTRECFDSGGGRNIECNWAFNWRNVRV